jgi:hypothetical protein
MERGPEQGLGRLVLKALAITSALTFLAIMMVNACLAPPRTTPVYAAPTKASPVLSPVELRDNAASAVQAPPAEPDPVYAPATKSMTVMRPRPLMQAPPQQAPQQAPAPQQQQGAR